MKKCAAFTLIELLIVIAIIGILAAMLLPAIQKGKQQAQTTRCVANTRQIAMGITMYLQDHDLELPWDSHTPPADKEKIGGKDSNSRALDKYIKDPEIFECPSDRMGKYRDTGSSYYYPLTDSHNDIIGCDDRSIRDDWLSYPTKKVVIYDACFDKINDPSITEKWHDSKNRAGVCGFLDGHSKKMKQDKKSGRPKASEIHQHDFY